MNKTLKQLFSLFLTMKLKQKVVLILVLLLIVGFFSFVVASSNSAHYQPLNYSGTERERIKQFLKEESLQYKEGGEGKIYLPENEIERVERELKKRKLINEDSQAGFELFDTNTWIKGEKELQMLEVRALKGQLEKDIAGFENVRHASVILDLAPQKLFGGSQYKTKASVILALEEEAELSTSQLRAITYHLSGAVRGLEPNMIAISDTTGKLYKAIYLNGEDELLKDPKLNLEETLAEKITKLMNRVVGKGNFHLTLHHSLEKEVISVALLIEQQVVDLSCKVGIENQIEALLAGFEGKKTIAIDFVNFERALKTVTSTAGHSLFTTVGFYAVLSFLMIAGGAFFFLRHSKEERKKDGIDIKQLASQIKDQKPRTIASMLKYLEPERAEELLSALPDEIQKKVAFHLSSEDL